MMWQISSISHKGICEFINDSLINFLLFLLLDPKTWGTLSFKFIMFVIIDLLYNINSKIYFYFNFFNLIIFHPINC